MSVVRLVRLPGEGQGSGSGQGFGLGSGSGLASGLGLGSGLEACAWVRVVVRFTRADTQHGDLAVALDAERLGELRVQREGHLVQLRRRAAAPVAGEEAAALAARRGGHLGCHGTRYGGTVRLRRTVALYGVPWHCTAYRGTVRRTVRGASGQAVLCLWYVQHAGGWYA
eukprot:scaffold86589_cov67-Phaeocystis_antarctica.AAC.1